MPNLTFAEYQTQAQDTDQLLDIPADIIDPRLPPLLGLLGEAGTLSTQYKKYLRDGEPFEKFEQHMEEEFGDVLWYLANATHKFGFSLEGIAERNLEKTADRWRSTHADTVLHRTDQEHFDFSHPPHEQLPRRFEVIIQAIKNEAGIPTVEIMVDGEPVADRLRDNTYDDSGYRYHDVFHFANAAVLGWSPVSRMIFNRKRKSNPVIDDVEDGGRAIVIEEAAAALAFAYGREHNYLQDITRLDYHLLKSVRSLISGLEASARHLWEIEESIIQGFAAWRQVRRHGGGTLIGDLENCSLSYRAHPQVLLDS